MKRWGFFFLTLLILTGCTQQQRPKEKLYFSVLQAHPVQQQATHFVEGVQVFTSDLGGSVVSAMVVNNPIRGGREALIALAIANKTQKTVPLKWEEISFFNPKNVVKMLPIDEVCDYFHQPHHTKPILGSSVFRNDLLKFGVISEKVKNSKDLKPTEKALADIYTGIKKDLCFVRLPHNTSLAPNSTTVGFLVILLPKENFVRRTDFMLKIPVGGDLHKLRYKLLPLD
ncbi:hypothetical protein [Hydrogenimonas urashimensis]|uniref:hypothetical protein n=1 Tax=Hydrogenimonas urashimensis TaxID=2740515 RepID=UPI001916921C|nr:hypothetical protein [Hydrogenimonas urashimensis]